MPDDNWKYRFVTFYTHSFSAFIEKDIPGKMKLRVIVLLLLLHGVNRSLPEKSSTKVIDTFHTK